MVSPGPPTKVVILENELVSNPTSRIDNNEYKIQSLLDEIDVCQQKIDAINDEANKEMIAIEQKFTKKRKPLYSQRNVMIEKIPNFWLTSIINHPHLKGLVHPEEEECLSYLTNIDIEEFEDLTSGYKICFIFGTNPFFSNESITKVFSYGSLGDVNSQNNVINWKCSMDLMPKLKYSALRNTHALHNYNSFFMWFENHDNPLRDTVAEIIKEDLWKNPLQYYLCQDIQFGNGIDSDEEIVVIENEEVQVMGESEEESDQDQHESDDFQIDSYQCVKRCLQRNGTKHIQLYYKENESIDQVVQELPDSSVKDDEDAEDDSIICFLEKG